MIEKTVSFYKYGQDSYLSKGVVLDKILYREKVRNEMPSGHGGTVLCNQYIICDHYLIHVEKEGIFCVPCGNVKQIISKV